jgi:hypothetical protein
MRDLTTRELARILSVSKQWKATILSSTEPQRKLFLLPARKESYFERSDSGLYTIVSQPSDSSKLIVEPHPIISPYWKRGWRTCVAID